MLDIKSLPTSPGVYLFKDKEGTIIYIGKAKSLRARVSQYFQKNKQELSVKTQHLVSRIASIDHIVVHNELEALLLENKLIKQHKPKYNIMLKDSKTYAYIKITDEQYPRIISTRTVTKKGAYFGPYADGSARVCTVKLLNRIFKLRTQKTVCRRPCMNYHIGLCSGVCVGKISREEYLVNIERAKEFLKGNTQAIEKKLEQDMKEFSKLQEYEQAKSRKEELEAIASIKQKQNVDKQTTFDQDIIAVVEGKNVIISMLHVRKGTITSKEQHRVDLQEDVEVEFLKAYYSSRPIPREIIINKNIDEPVLETYLASLRGTPASIIVPERGDKKKLLDLALANASSNITLAVQEALDLLVPPEIIEFFDISNLGREHIVAGMVRFVDGKPDRAGYRRFAMREQAEQNDYAAMHEAVFRRYNRLKKEGAQLPSLIIIDGGKGQLGAACEALREARVDVPICSLAKQEEELFFPERAAPLRLDKNSPVMLYLRNIRDRTHNFAISYNRQKRRIKRT